MVGPRSISTGGPRRVRGWLNSYRAAALCSVLLRAAAGGAGRAGASTDEQPPTEAQRGVVGAGVLQLAAVGLDDVRDLGLTGVTGVVGLLGVALALALVVTVV